MGFFFSVQLLSRPKTIGSDLVCAFVDTSNLFSRSLLFFSIPPPRLSHGPNDTKTPRFNIDCLFYKTLLSFLILLPVAIRIGDDPPP